MVSNVLAASSVLTQWSISTVFAHAWFCVGHEGELISFSASDGPRTSSDHDFWLYRGMFSRERSESAFR